MLTWDIVTEKLQAEARDAEMASDTAAINQLLLAMNRASTEREVAKVALDIIREAFGWSYGATWEVDTAARVLRFTADSGSTTEDFRRTTREATYHEGEGPLGTVWRTKDMVVLNEMPESIHRPRPAAANAAGLRSAVGLPILVDGLVAGALDFVSNQTLHARRAPPGDPPQRRPHDLHPPGAGPPPKTRSSRPSSTWSARSTS